MDSVDAARSAARAGSWWPLIGASVLAVLISLGLAGCSGGSASTGTADATIDQAGGTVKGPDGLEIVVPPGALDSPTTIRITRNAPSAPSLASIAPPKSDTYEITPHGLAFHLPVTVRFPAGTQLDPANPQVLIAPQGGAWSRAAASVRSGMLEVERTTFSFFYFGGPYVCSSTDLARDPYFCDIQYIERPTVTWLPPTAITNLNSLPTVTDNAALTFDFVVGGAPDCTNGVLEILRSQYQTPYSSVPTPVLISTTAVGIPLNSNHTHVLVGDPSDPNFQITAANNGRVEFTARFACQRSVWASPQSVSGSLGWPVAISSPPPSGPGVSVTEPADLTITEGTGPATFTVNATGTGPFTYQWRRDGTPIAGATAASYVLPSPTAANDSGHTFSVDVSSPWGPTATSRDALLIVLASGSVGPVAVTVNPPGLTIFSTYPGSNKSFKALATGGNPPYAFQWSVNGQSLPTVATTAVTAGGCDLTSVDYTEQGSRLFLNGFGSNCTGSATVDVTVTVSDALGNTGTATAAQRIAPSTSEPWQVRLVSQFNDVLDPAGLGNGINPADDAVVDSAGGVALLRPSAGVIDDLFRFSATVVPSQVSGVAALSGILGADGLGNVLYFTSDNTLHAVGPNGAPTLLAGIPNTITTPFPPPPVDGNALTQATFSGPWRVTANPTTGDVYVVELLASASQSVGPFYSLVRRISQGQVTTLVDGSAGGQPVFRDLALDASTGTIYLLAVDSTSASVYTLNGRTPTLFARWNATSALPAADLIAAGDGTLYAMGGRYAYQVSGTGPTIVGGQGTNGTGQGAVFPEGPASLVMFANGVQSFSHDAVGHTLVFVYGGAVYRLLHP
jgi:hypothetical protein